MRAKFFEGPSYGPEIELHQDETGKFPFCVLTQNGSIQLSHAFGDHVKNLLVDMEQVDGTPPPLLTVGGSHLKFEGCPYVNLAIEKAWASRAPSSSAHMNAMMKDAEKTDGCLSAMEWLCHPACYGPGWKGGWSR